jgi:hypothetical protein
MKTVSAMSAIFLCLGQAALAAEVPASVYKPMDRKTYPKAFATWGAAGVKKIDTLRKQAALKAAQSSECDKVDISELSSTRSSPPDNIVILTDCANGKRFYFNAADLQAGGAPVSQETKMKRVSDEEAKAACENSVRASLEFPSTMSLSWGGKSVYRAPTTGNVVVTFDFDAKNRLGAELPYKARCVIDDRGLNLPEISGR